MGRVFDQRLRALDAGVVPARVHLRPRPPARRGRLAGSWLRLAGQAPLLAAAENRSSQRVMVDIDDTIIEVHGYAKQGSGYGYSGVRGLNALLATVSTADDRAGGRGPTTAQRIVRFSAGREATGRRRAEGPPARCRARPACGRWCGPTPRSTAAHRRGALYGRCATSRSPCGWTPRSRPRSLRSATTPGPRSSTPTPSSTRQAETWVSRAEVAEIPFTAFAAQKKADQVPGRLVVRRIPDLNPGSKDGQADAVRHLAVPRVLHHHRPRRGRHRRRGQDPPRPRDHRTGPRRPEELRPRAPALGASSPPTPPGSCWP